MPSETVDRRKRGRPEITAEDRARMRKKIEAKALALFQREGYGAVSMRRIASEIGCSPMTLYSYFENKIDILRALWAQVFRELFGELEPRLSRVKDPRKRLRLLAAGYVGYWLDHPEHYRMVFMAEGVSQPEVGVFIDDPEISRRLGLFVATLAEAARPGLPSAELKARTDLLLCTLQGIAHCRITMSGFPWTSEQVLLDRAIDSVLRQ